MTSQQEQTVVALRERRALGCVRPTFQFTDEQRQYIRNTHKAEMLGLLEIVAEEIIDLRLQNGRDWLLPVLEILDQHKERIERT